MKRGIYLVLILFLTINTISASNYYWVGGVKNNNWSSIPNWKIGSFTGSSASVLPRDTDNVVIGNGTNNATIILDINDTINNITMQGSGQIFIMNPSLSVIKTLFIKGNTTSNNSNSTGGGTAIIKIYGGNNQSLSGNSTTSGVGKLPNITISKNGGTLSLSNNLTMGGSTKLIYESGTISSGTSNFVFYYNNTIDGNMVLDNVEFQGNNSTFIILDTITVNGNLTINGNSACSLDSGRIELFGNLVIQNGVGTPSTTSVLAMRGTNNQTYAYSAIKYACHFNWEINKDSGTVTPANGTTGFFCTSFKLLYGAFTAPSGIFYIGDSHSLSSIPIFQQSNGTFNNNHGKVQFNPIGNNLQFKIDVIGSTQFNEVNFNIIPITNNSRITGSPNDTIHILDSLFLTNGILDSIALRVEGNVNVASSFDGGNAPLIFAGSNKQHFFLQTADLFDGNICLNKEDSSYVKMESNITLNGSNQTLNFINGYIQSAYVFEIGNGVTASGANDSSFIIAAIIKRGNSDFIFPVGNHHKYRPLEISAPSLTSTSIKCEYFDTRQDLGSESDSTIEKIGNCEYWHLTSANSDSLSNDSVKVKLSWGPGSCNILDNLNEMRIARWDNAISKWKNLGNGGTTGNKSAGTIITINKLSSIGYFALAQKFYEMDFSSSTTNQVKEDSDSTGAINYHVSGGKKPYEFIFQGNMIPNRTLLNEFFDTLNIDTTSFTNEDYEMIENMKYDSSYYALNSSVYTTKIIDQREDTVNIQTLLGQEIDWLNEGMDITESDIPIEKINSLQYVLRSKGMDIEKTNNDGWENGQIFSQQHLAPGGDVKIEFNVNDASNIIALGLMNPENEIDSMGYSDIDYGLLFQNSNFYSIEYGDTILLDTYENGDRFLIEVINKSADKGGKGGNADEIGYGLVPDEPKPLEFEEVSETSINYYKNGGIVKSSTFNSKKFYVIKSAGYSRGVSLSHVIILSGGIGQMKLQTISGKITDSDCGLHNGSIDAAVMIPMIFGTSVSPTYTWKDANNTVIGTTLDISNLASGTYTLYYSDGINTASASFYVGYKVLWNNLVNTSVGLYPGTNILTKVSGSNTIFDGGGASFNMLKDNIAGWFEFPIVNYYSPMTNSYNMEIGFVDNDINSGFTTGGFGIYANYFNWNGYPLALLIGFDQGGIVCLSTWNTNDIVRFNRSSSGSMQVFRNGVSIGTFLSTETNSQIIDASIDYIGVSTGKVRCSFECPFSDPYFVLSRSLDGGVYFANDHLKFKFTEEYKEQDTELSYKIFDKNNEELPLTGSLPIINAGFGEGYFDVDLTTISDIVLNGVYVLEVQNQKGEKFYLRFKKT